MTTITCQHAEDGPWYVVTHNGVVIARTPDRLGAEKARERIVRLELVRSDTHGLWS